MSKIFNNTTDRVVDDLKATLKQGDKVAVASACFSIYAFQALKDQLKGVNELRFLFTSPTFTVPEKIRKESREYFIPKRGREQSLYGTAFEVRLRNELTQKAIARECADWIREKVRFRTNMTDGAVTPFVAVNDEASYAPVTEFTTVGLGAERGNTMTNFVFKQDSAEAKQLLASFEPIWNDPVKVKDVTEDVLDSITAAYRENAPELVYYLTLYTIFNEFLDDVNADAMPDDAVGFKESKIWGMLYDFQRDAVLSIIHKLERFNGCILADSVGLGKTFTALAVIKYYEKRNKNVLVLCPKKLTNNWNTYRANYKNNPLVADRFGYQVLFHTDLSRTRGVSNGIDLSLINWENYDLVVIDESHNFRNGGHEEEDEEGNLKLNRYSSLMENVVKKGVKTKVLMLSATPVNNRFTDLRNQLELAYEGDSSELDAKLQTTNCVSEVFRQAQKAFGEWSRLEAKDRTLEELLKRLSVDFFTVLDAVTIARSRKHIRSYYNMDAIGQFPERLAPQKHSPELTDLPSAPTYELIYEALEKLNLMVYVPTNFIFPSKMKNYAGQKGYGGVDLEYFADFEDVFEEPEVSGLTQLGREQGIRKLMGIGLLKRLESSVFAFTSTVEVVLSYMRMVVERIDDFEKCPSVSGEAAFVGRKIKIRLEDMDWKSYRELIKADIGYLSELHAQVKLITPEHDLKLRRLIDVIGEKLASPLNEGNRKLLIFSAFTDTAEYLYRSIAGGLLADYGLHSGLVTGDSHGSRSTLEKCPCDFNDVLTCFSPRSKEKKLLFSNREDPGEIDILFASDCVSEGQNLQDCDMVVNYDIHWNPCRIIQRYGRVDRIGSVNKRIQLVNFWPNVSLDRYIQLRDRVESRMKALNIAATGDENPLALDDPELEFRKRQLQRLKDEAVDLEDMRDGISIMDLGLSEFQQDLLAYVKANPNTLEKLPHGINAVVEATESLPEGVIFVLRNINTSVNVNQANRLHPYYLVYIGSDGQILARHTDPKGVLDDFRLLAKGKSTFDTDLVRAYNKETKNGKDMRACSELLGSAIASLVERQAESDIDSLFGNTDLTSALESSVEGLDDFELITFLVVRRRG
jgi:superfamily II DNA or RNA helicase